MRVPSAEPFPAWADAHLALKYINKGKARGSRAGLSVRGESQKRLGQVGSGVRARRWLFVIVGIVSLAILCIFIQKIKLDTTLDSLWTPDSGRLQQELMYVSKATGFSNDTNEILIQTPKKNGHRSILTAKALLEHLDVLQKALGVTVDKYDLTWRLKDICYAPNIPTFDIQFIDAIFEKIYPCGLITPLDCFWEGAKLLGPDFPVQVPGFRGIKWTNLHPEELLRMSRILVRQGNINVQGFPFETLEGFMKRSGIGSGYQEKPCLNPLDPECPTTAPNKGSTSPPDVASILARGCYGFAPRFMHWAPDLIIGGQERNKSGNLIKAGGLMSTVQLMSYSELFEYAKGTWQLNGLQDWTVEKARDVLDAWQTRFTEEVTRLTLDDDRSNQFNFYSFTASGLDRVVESASQFSWFWGGIRVFGVSLTTSLVGVALSGNLKEWETRFCLLFGGSIVSFLGTVAGCGLCGLAGIPFNVATVQVLPYLVISIGSQVSFLLLFSQLNGGCDVKATLKRHGFSIVLGVLTIAVFVGAGGLFAIPAVRSLALEGAILIMASSFALLLIFPAICEIALHGRRSSKSIAQTQNNIPFVGITTNKTTPAPLHPVNINVSGRGAEVDCETGKIEESENSKRPKTWTEVYFWILSCKWFTGIAFLLYLSWLIFSGLGVLHLRLGLPITDVVPSNSSEWTFLTVQTELFPVYHIRAVTKANFDYPNNQKLLHKFHETMSSLPWIIGDDNGGKPPMWLSVFRQWLIRLQKIFDDEWKQGFLEREGWTTNASADGILAWKLAVQTGHADHPVDVTQVPSNRLVDNEGIINPRAFYVYLSAWAWNDPLAFGSTAANLRPEPKNWIHLPEDKELKIAKSYPIKYAEISYTLKTSREEDNTGSTEAQILTFVREIRKICATFEARGLPVFPWGTPFRYYEQYLDLPFDSGVVVGVATGMILVMLFFSLGFSLRPVGVVASVVVVTMVEIVGTIGWLGIGLNSLPVEIALFGVSFVVFSTIQYVVAFCCVPGKVETRRCLAFSLVGPPCVQSLLSISLTALILYSPDFIFIFTHFTLLISISALFAVLNFLFLVPLLFKIFKPKCWLTGTCTEDPTILLPLTPSPPPKKSSSRFSSRHGSSGRSSSRNSRNNYHQPPPYSARGTSSSRSGGYSRNCTHNRAPSENSLSTITEEPTSCATRRSAEIVVQPQVVVETFGGSGDNGSLPMTKTKVSAKLKVEVHSSLHSNPQSSLHLSENSGTSASASTSCSSSNSSSPSSSTSSYE